MCMQSGIVRTTIAIKPEHRAKLLELAARRGEKGFSFVIAEALDSYLENLERNQELSRRALQLRGTLTKSDSERLRREAGTLRRSWR